MAQDVQLVCPGKEKEPAGHVRQLELPRSAEAEPAEQGVHPDAPAGEKVPAAQTAQAMLAPCGE